MSPEHLTKAQCQEIKSLHTHAWIIRGLQFFILVLSTYLAVFEGRGWPSLIIGALVAVWLQRHLPILPTWLENLRSKASQKIPRTP